MTGLLITPAEAAKRLGVGRSRVMQLIKAGKVQAVPVFTGGRRVQWQVSAYSVEARAREVGK